MSRAEPAVALDEPTLALENGPTLALGAEAPGADAPARLESCLVALHGVRPGRRWNLDRPQLLIGRGEHCEIVLPIDTVSRRHARLVVRAGGVSLQDLGSTNGTAVNDVAVAADEEVSLSSGDLVRVGGALLRFLCDADLEALYHEEIHRTIVHDGLTGACSRRRLFEQLEREMSRSRRHGRPLALLLVDVDRLGRLNDDLGHLSGDAVLREVAVRLAGRLRPEDVLARFGGGTFAALLPEADLEAARAIAERLREAVAGEPFFASGELVSATASVGVAAMDGALREPDAFLAAADARLREAKDAGRDCVRG